MKKLFFTLIIMALSFGAFAQYQGTYWGEDLQVFVHDKGVLKGGSEMGYSYYREPKHMAGQASELYYIFSRNKLAGIAYAVEWNEETEKKILNNFEKFPNQKIKEGRTTLKETEIPENTKFELLFLDDVIGTEQGESSVLGYILNRNEEGPAAAYIFDNEKKSRIYIYSNVFNNKIVVVYRPQPEEF